MQLLHILEDDRCYVIVLEYCKNGTLKQMVEARNRLTPFEIRFFGQQLIQVLLYMQSKNVLHRDLCLANCLLNEKLVIKLCDFEFCAELSSSHATRFTQIGFYHFRPPEMCNRQGYSVKSNSWALGCLLYQMAVGHYPFGHEEKCVDLVKLAIMR